MGRIIYTLILIGLSIMLLSGSQNDSGKSNVEKQTKINKTVHLERASNKF
jgi:hypothetical protein